MSRTCSIDGCEGKFYGRGWCNTHYARWRRHGDPAVKLTNHGMPFDQRVATFFIRGEGCWLWTGALTDGYGQVSADGTMRYAHVVMYELEVGAVPDGKLLDHRCRQRNCVRPDHLRVVTNKQNSENLSGPNRNNTTSGVRGVAWHKHTSRWIAQIGHNNGKYYVGVFDTIEEAEAAVIAKRNELFTHNDLDRSAA